MIEQGCLRHEPGSKERKERDSIQALNSSLLGNSQGLSFKDFLPPKQPGEQAAKTLIFGRHSGTKTLRISGCYGLDIKCSPQKFHMFRDGIFGK